MTNHPEESLAKKLHDTLAESDLSFAGLSAKTGYPVSNLKRWLYRRPDQLTIRSIILICDALDLKVSVLMLEVWS